MLKDLYNKKHRFRDFFSDGADGFLLIWNSGRQLTLVNFILFLVQGVLPLGSLWVLKHLIDHARVAGFQWSTAAPDLLLFAGLQLLAGIAAQLSTYKLAQQQQIISDDIAGRVLHKAVALDLEYYENPAFFDELHMAQQQSLSRPAQLIAAYQGILQSLIVIVLCAGFMAMANWWVLLLIVLLSVPLAISKLLHGYQQYKQDRESMPAQRKASSLFHYLTTDEYAKEVRLFNFGSVFIDRFLHLRKSIFKRREQLHYRFLKQNILIQFFEIGVTTVIYCVMIGGAITGAITIGGLVIYFQVFQRLQSAITNLFQSAINLFQNQLYLRQILNYLASPVLARAAADTQLMPAQSQTLAVKGLNFTYPQTEHKVLHDVHMQFQPGRITAIVGENGSGKSTLIKLLCRLYVPADGSIFLGEKDISSFDINALRQYTTVMFQDFGKYYLTVEENITLGAHHKDKSRLDEAAAKAELGDKIKSFPAGYKTQLGRNFRNGEQLSGGQWQKVALARMFFKNSPIVILDEPTSSMDPVAEHAIFENLKQEIGDKTVILVTHRLYNLKLADHIYVMEKGRVAEHGSFDELLAANGAFANIYDKQKV